MSNIPNITSFEILETQIAKVGGKPTVLEVLWDGDTQGWFLRLSIYTKTGYFFYKKISKHYLGYMKLGTDFRLFVGGEWTEASLAKEFGQKAIEKYGLEFYFPSPDEPDYDCPEWENRHLAINCADCSKLIIPTDSPYLPKNICHNCHLNRKHEEEKNSIKDIPCDDGIIMFLYRNIEDENIGHYSIFEDFLHLASDFKDLRLPPLTKAKVEGRCQNQAINIIRLDKNDILELEQELKPILHQQLEGYVKPVLNEIQQSFHKIRKLEYDGIEYELAPSFDEKHHEIEDLIDDLKTAQKALAENCIYEIHFTKGITYRDYNVLRFIANENNAGAAAIETVKAHYKNILTENELLRTIEKLQNIGCLLLTDNKLTITDIGKCII